MVCLFISLYFKDFDDWDDVGLNISKPPELLALYRDGLKHNALNSCTISTQTENEEVQNKEDCSEHVSSISKYFIVVNVYDFQIEKLEILQEKLLALENENSELRHSNSKLEEELKQLSSQLTVTHAPESSTSPTYNPKIEKNSIGSESPERFEMVDKNMPLFKHRGSIVTLDDNISNNSFNPSDWMNINIQTDTQMENTSKKIDLDNR